MKKGGDDFSGGPVFDTVRTYAKHRILNDMVEQARRHAHSKDYMIMVLDQAALRVFSSCCKFFDVYKANLYHIERLEVKRKRFPHTDALYFISPTKESVEHLLADFSEDGAKKPAQYGAVHLCFTSRLSEELIRMIALSKHLAPRVLSFNEINLDFFLFNDNVFHLARKNTLPAIKLAEDKGSKALELPAVSKLLDELCHRLFTVCSVFMEYPYVQYQGNSHLARSLALKVNDQL
jgi:syntaxin-binding protein 1